MLGLCLPFAFCNRCVSSACSILDKLSVVAMKDQDALATVRSRCSFFGVFFILKCARMRERAWRCCARVTPVRAQAWAGLAFIPQLAAAPGFARVLLHNTRILRDVGSVLVSYSMVTVCRIGSSRFRDVPVSQHSVCVVAAVLGSDV